jgi:hypothetical protein
MLIQMALQVIQIGLHDRIEKVILAALGALETLVVSPDFKPELMSKGEIPIHIDNTMLVPP